MIFIFTLVMCTLEDESSNAYGPSHLIPMALGSSYSETRALRGQVVYTRLSVTMQQNWVGPQVYGGQSFCPLGCTLSWKIAFFTQKRQLGKISLVLDLSPKTGRIKFKFLLSLGQRVFLAFQIGDNYVPSYCWVLLNWVRTKCI